MKTFTWILFSLLIVVKLQAQDVQVTLVDPCASIDKKSTIIINDNVMTANALSKPATDYNTVNFTLTSGVNTSAGIYNASGNLVRTLWSGVRYDAGNYKAVWSGIMDDGTQAPPGTYQFKVLTNNVKYTWEGVIGNTSTDLTGAHIVSALPLGMCFIGNTGYAATGYSEHGSVQKQFNVSDPNKWTSGIYTQTTQSSERVCTDGNIVYWAGGNYYSNDYWVYGSYPSDNCDPNTSMFPFSAGVQKSNSDASGAFNYSNAISVTKGNAAAAITAICVQKNGNYLFVSRNGTNQLQILNKTTGALLQTLTFNNIQGIACDDNYLYVVTNNTLLKYSIGSGGAIVNTNTSFSGLINPYCVAISPDNSTLAIGDWGTQQVKFFAVSGGVSTGVLGQPNTYISSPYVANDKFLRITFLAYQPDGSLWVGDALKDGGTVEQSGNNNHRILLYDVNRNYINQVATLNFSRSTCADLNNPTRVFGDFLEYERDYSKPLDNGPNGSWKLKANWGVNINDFDIYDKFRQVITLSNGKTYAIVRRGSKYIFDLYELTNTGARNTGITTYGYIGGDGTLFNTYDSNGQKVVAKQLLTGFDGNNNPVWGNMTTFATSPIYGYYDPVGDPTYGYNNSSDKYIFFSHSGPAQSSNDNPSIGYHLGAIKAGENSYVWKASRSTFTDYQGDYPTNGDFDIGNGWPSQHSLTHAMVYGHDIFWNANGEFWKNGQINIWNHFYDNGLFIGQFGTTGEKAGYAGPGAAGMAGNAYGTSMVKMAGSYYIYHCDESVHAGVHSWHVTGLNTVAEQTVQISVSQAVVPINDPNNLMVGLPYRSTTFTGGNGFSVSYPAGLILKTNTLQYQKDCTDIALGGNGNLMILKDLKNTASLKSWKLTASIGYQNGEPTFGTAPDGSDNYNYLELLDQGGKIIFRFIGNQVDTRNNYYPRVWFNNVIVAQGADVNGINQYNFRDISLTYNAGKLTFKHQDYSAVSVTSPFETGANIAAPAYLRVNQSGNRTRYINLCKLSFATNSF